MRELIDALAGKWIPLTNRAVFRIKGPDRVRFLNGQVTNDVSKNLNEKAVAACLCALKGKVEALLWISASEDSLILDGELSQREAIFNRLDRYLIADDCEIVDETERMKLVHHFIDGQPGVVSIRVGKVGKDLWVQADALSSDFVDADQISPTEFTAAGILACVPRAGYEISGETFPAELGLDRWAVDFHKGCYLGQEIVSRIESVGRVKRVLRPIMAKTPTEIGENVTNSLEETGKITGPFELVSENYYVGLGLFSAPEDCAELAEFEAVSFI
ncbi:MAG: folate-binding protein YgfZ [Verrucomicrobiales bacterium]|nr:folate-binding protein YgfZ [Verrucomicrobiales bacterium]